MTKSIGIIGGGIAGLSAGCYARASGYDATIFEMHDKPGGLCTAWRRKGYLFDGCIREFVGINPRSQFHRVWQELDGLPKEGFVELDNDIRYEGGGNKAFTLFSDADRLEQHMLELSPKDSGPIKEFTRGIRHFSRLDAPIDKPSELIRPLEGMRMLIKMIPYLGAFRRYGKISVGEYARRFTDPFLREAFESCVLDPVVPVVSAMMMQAWFHNRDVGLPLGGSLALAKAVEGRFVALGGLVRCGSRVDRILVSEGRATGARLADGSEERFDFVISAADGRTTLFEMLGGLHADPILKACYDHWPLFPSWVQVSYGTSRDFSDQAHTQAWRLDRPVLVAGRQKPVLTVKHYCHDPTMAPQGKSVVAATFTADYEDWVPLKDNPEQYRAEKVRILDQITDILERRYPGFGRTIEITDVATPLTFERYTGNWKGSINGWMVTPETMKVIMGKGLPKQLPGLRNFYMAGQWVEPGGGLPSAAVSGRNVIQLICAADRIPFAVPAIRP